jgi:hypothetical protein
MATPATAHLPEDICDRLGSLKDHRGSLNLSQSLERAQKYAQRSPVSPSTEIEAGHDWNCSTGFALVLILVLALSVVAAVQRGRPVIGVVRIAGVGGAVRVIARAS